MAERTGELLRGLLADIGDEHPDAGHLRDLIGQNDQYLGRHQQSHGSSLNEVAVATFPLPPFDGYYNLFLKDPDSRNVLVNPITPGEWEIALGNGMGESLADLLGKLTDKQTLLSVREPVDDLGNKLLDAFKGIEVPVAGIQMISLQKARKVAKREIARWKYQPGGNPVAVYIGSLYEGARQLDHVLFPTVESSWDVDRVVRMDSIFFQKLWRQGIQERFDPAVADTGHQQWRPFDESLSYEAYLLASGNATEAAKITPFRELCFAGNYPMGMNANNEAVVLVA